MTLLRGPSAFTELSPQHQYLASYTTHGSWSTMVNTHLLASAGTGTGMHRLTLRYACMLII